MTSPRTRIINVHVCDERAQVITVVRSSAKDSRTHSHRRSPCAECPWRLDSPIGRFPAEAYRHSASTCFDMARSTFACHMQGRDKPMTCAGFLLSGSAIHNMTVRLALAAGALDLKSIDASIPVYSSYREMAVANGVAPDDVALAACRDE